MRETHTGFCAVDGVNLLPEKTTEYDMYCPQAGLYPEKMNFLKSQCVARPTCDGCKKPKVVVRPKHPGRKPEYGPEVALSSSAVCRFCGDPLPVKRVGRRYKGMLIDFCRSEDCLSKRKAELSKNYWKKPR